MTYEEFFDRLVTEHKDFSFQMGSRHDAIYVAGKTKVKVDKEKKSVEIINEL